MIRRPHDVGIVLDHQNRVSQIAQIVQNLDQPVCIAPVQPDRWFIEHISVPTNRDPRRSRKLNALRLAAGERRDSRSSVRYSRPTSFRNRSRSPNFLKQSVCNVSLLLSQFHLLEELQSLFDSEAANFANILSLKLDLTRFQPQPRSVAIRTDGISAIPAQEYAHMQFVFLALEVGEEPAHTQKTSPRR